MKRRAQAGAVPPATKKRKSAKDEKEAQKQTLHEYAAPTQDRTPSSSAMIATHAAVHVNKSNTSSTSSGASNTSDKGRRTTTDLATANRPSTTSPSTGKYTAVVASSSQHDKTSRPTTTAATPVSSISTQNQIATQISPLSTLSPTINYTICWARVNRSPWWPGKVCDPHPTCQFLIFQFSFIFTFITQKSPLAEPAATKMITPMCGCSPLLVSTLPQLVEDHERTLKSASIYSAFSTLPHPPIMSTECQNGE